MPLFWNEEANLLGFEDVTASPNTVRNESAVSEFSSRICVGIRAITVVGIKQVLGRHHIHLGEFFSAPRPSRQQDSNDNDVQEELKVADVTEVPKVRWVLA